VTIGIIDDFDFAHLPDQIAGKSTACRYNVVEHSDPGTHGNIVTEVVARMTAAVPTIQLCLYPAGTAAELRDIVAHAAAHHVDVLTNSMSFFDEYDFFDGRSQLAQDIRRGLGSQIVFVVSAGNYGDGHYWGNFAHAANRGWHEFASGQEALTLNIDGSVELFLNWDSWRSRGGFTQALDLVLYSDDLKTEVAKSQTSAEDEFFQWIERKNLHGTFKVAVRNSSLTARPVAFHLFVLHDAEVDPRDRQMLAARRSLLGVVQPIDNVIAVGAVRFPQGAMWAYSSQGPTGDDRAKPDLVGYSPVPSELKRKADGEAAAHGTSFTAPQVAAAAAWLRAKNPGLSAAEIKRILLQSASAPAGRDASLFGSGGAYGAGILNLRRAFESALLPQAMPGARGLFLFHP
jgi:subtilisin family serine protease